MEIQLKFHLWVEFRENIQNIQKIYIKLTSPELFDIYFQFNF